jgi:hypothetical protein
MIELLQKYVKTYGTVGIDNLECYPFNSIADDFPQPQLLPARSVHLEGKNSLSIISVGLFI